MLKSNQSTTLNDMEIIANDTIEHGLVSAEIASIAPLKVIYCLTSAAIIIVNCILLWRLVFRVKKTRSTILFIFLSASDILVAVISIPILALALFKPNTKGCVTSCYAFILFNYFPYGYSWVLTVAIALDRCFLVTNKHKYEKVISKKRVIALAIVLLILEAGLSFFYVLIDRQTRLISLVILEVLCIMVTILSYFYLLIYVRRSTKNATRNQRRKSGADTRLTRVIVYIFFCQVLLTLPQWIGLFFSIILNEGRVSLNGLNNQRIRIRWMTILRFQNSYLNACILLYNQYKEYKIFQRRNDKSQSLETSTWRKPNMKSISTSNMKSLNYLDATSETVINVQ